jgi:GT2 family glycosyltransferase
VQHAGVVIGMRGTADHVMRGFPANSDGYAGSLSCTREVSAVTGACLAIRRQDYQALGGLVDHYATHYQDVDLCLQVRALGKRILCVPRARLYHDESATRGSAYDLLDRALLLDSWGKTITPGDPYYNANFWLERSDYSLRPDATP